MGVVYDPKRQAEKWAKITEAAKQVVQAYAQVGVNSFVEFISSVTADMGKLNTKQRDAFKEAWDAHHKGAPVPESPIGDVTDKSEVGERAKELMGAAIDAGYGSTKETWKEVVDAVHEQLSLEVPGISRYDIMQAMSDYGQWRQLNREEKADKIRAIRGKARQSLKLEDSLNAIALSQEWLDQGMAPEEVAQKLRDQNLLPKATGREQATPDSIEKGLIAQVDKLKHELPVHVESKPGQLKTASERYRKAQEKRLAFWENRRDEAKQGRLPKRRKKRPPAAVAIIDKNVEIEHVQAEALTEIEKAKRANWNAGQWIGAGLLETTSLIPKGLMLGMEWSFFIRQGFFYARSHPIKAFAAAVDGIHATFSQRIAMASTEDIESRPNAREYHQGGVDFTRHHGPRAALEEMSNSAVLRWLEHTEGKVFLPLRTVAKVYMAFERGNRTFANTMKADLYDIQKRDTLAAREFFGDSANWTDNDIKQTGRTSNIFSGRGTGLKGGNPYLDFFFLARRWAWSRIQTDLVVPFQLMTPQRIGQWNADRGMRVAMAKLYLQTLLGHATKLAVSYWLYSLLAGDDEEKKPTIEWDLRSSDVGALKMGETRIKSEGGTMPLVTLGARVLTGTMKTSKGEIKSIYGEDVQYGGQTAADFIINYGRYKLGTGMSGILEWASGYDAVGNLVSKKDIVATRVTPLTHREIVDAEKELGFKQGTLVALEAIFGATVSTYGDRTTYRNSTKEERKKQFEKDLRGMEWDTPPLAYSEFLTPKQLEQAEDRKVEKQELVTYWAFFTPNRKDYITKGSTVFRQEAYDKRLEEVTKALETFKEMGITHDEAQKLLVEHFWRPTTENSEPTDMGQSKSTHHARAEALAKFYDMDEKEFSKWWVAFHAKGGKRSELLDEWKAKQ